jgi:NAD(P)H dehydrogenase (quinone)
MKSRVAVIYYSSYGHTHEMAKAVAEGATKNGAEVRLRRVAELPDAEKAMSGQDAYREAQAEQADVGVATLDDLRWADGIVWGIPTRYGNMPAQVKQFIDTTGALWQNGELEDKATGIFTSTATIHGGQESTILTSLVPMLHLGMVFVGTPYSQNPQIMTTDGVGGSPYGPGTLAGTDGARQPVEDELETARRLGSRVAEVGLRLRPMREKQDGEQGQQADRGDSAETPSKQRGSRAA